MLAGGRPSADRIAPLAAFAVLTGCLVSKIYDLDVWFHLAIGREIVARGGAPASEFHVWPVLGEPAKFHEWGFGVLTFLTHEALGFAGLAVLNAALGAGAVACFVAAAIRRGASTAAAIALAGPLAFVIAHRVQYRPEGFLFVALGATVYALERARSDRRWLFTLPAITLVLSLFHPSALFVLFVAGCFGLDAIRTAWRDRAAASELRWLAISMALAVLVIGVVPYGFEQLTKPFAFASQELGLSELRPVLSTTLAPTFVALCLVAVASLVAERRASDVVLVVAFAVLTHRHVRGIPLFAFAVYPVATLATSRVLSLLPWRRAPAGVAAASALVASIAFAASPEWGSGPPAGWLPERTAEYLRSTRADGKLLNSMGPGGFLAWRLYPERLVSVDGHFFARNESHRLESELFSLPPGALEALETRGITAVAVPGVFSPTGTLAPLTAALVASPEWQLVVAEPAGLLFVRGASGDVLDKRLAWRNVADGAHRVLATYGEQRAPRARLSLAVAFLQLRELGAAATEFARYSALVPSDAEAAQLAALLAAHGRGEPGARAPIDARPAAAP